MKPEDYKYRRSAIKDAIRYHKQRQNAMEIALFKLNEEAREQLEKARQEPVATTTFPLMLTEGTAQ